MSEVLKGRNLILIAAVGILLASLGSMPLANAQPYYDAHFTSIKVTHGNGDIELISGGTAKVYDGQPTWKNLTFYNEACGLLGADLYTKIYRNEILVGTSEARRIFTGSYGHDNWYSTEYGPATKEYKVELWWNSYGTHYLEDVNYFNIKIVKLLVTNWSPATLSIEKGKTTSSTLSISLDNGGNDYMYSAEISVVDSDGLNVSPQSQSLGDISSGGTKSTSFSITAPTTATLGTHTVSFQIDYDDFRDGSHSETKTAPVSVTKLGTSMTLNLGPSSVKTGDSTTITATLVDGNENPIQNQEITFSVGTTTIGTASTDSSGSAVKSYTANIDAGTYVIRASYTGSTDYGPSNATSNLIVNPFTTSLTIVVPSATEGKECIIKATLKDENDNPCMHTDIGFYIYEENAWKKIGTAETDSNGVASLEYTPTSTGTFQFKAMFSGTANYAQSSSTSTDLNVAMDYTLYYIGGGMIAVAIIGVVGYIVFRRRKKATPIPKTTEKPKTKKK